MIKKILIGILLLSGMVSAQNNTTRFFVAYDYENITVANSSIGFTSSKITTSSQNAQSATFTITCASGTDCPIRMTIDGTTPTTTVGLRAVHGQSITIYSYTNILAFRAIREGATSAVINVTYFR